MPDPTSDGQDHACSICLENAFESPMPLACGHTFCHPCLAQHAETNLQACQQPWCPLCRCKLQGSEVLALCPSACATGNSSNDHDDNLPLTIRGQLLRRFREHMEARAFRR